MFYLNIQMRRFVTKQINLSLILVGLLLLQFPYQLIYADSDTQVVQRLSKLKGQIDQINLQLRQKQYKEQGLKQAIVEANVAITQSDAVLLDLKQKQSYSLKQLKQIRTQLSGLIQTVDTAKDSIESLLRQVYQELQYAKSTEQSVFITASAATARNIKQRYLVAVLADKKRSLIQLQLALASLDRINAEVEKELSQLDDAVDDTVDYKQKLIQDKHNQVKQAKEVELQIAAAQKRLQNLQRKQEQLNKLLANLGESATTVTTTKTTKIVYSKSENKANSILFLKHQLVRPFTTKIAVNFGEMRNEIRSNGVLFDSASALAKNNSVYAVAGGKVVYVGSLAGFGNLIIIDHGSSYVSIYSGVNPNVSKGGSISAGEVIATASDKSNQPMGGVYFELRHLGQPINPKL